MFLLRTLVFLPAPAAECGLRRAFLCQCSDDQPPGNPCKILEFLHVKPGKGSAFVRTKVKNLITSNTLEKTFRAVRVL